MKAPLVTLASVRLDSFDSTRWVFGFWHHFFLSKLHFLRPFLPMCVSVMHVDGVKAIICLNGANTVESSVVLCSLAVQAYFRQRNIRTSRLNTGGVALHRHLSRYGQQRICLVRSWPTFHVRIPRRFWIVCRHC